MATKLKYDGLLELPPEDIEEHKKVFLHKEEDGKTFFYFEYISLGKNAQFGKCYGMIKNTKPNRKKLAALLAA